MLVGIRVNLLVSPTANRLVDAKHCDSLKTVASLSPLAGGSVGPPLWLLSPLSPASPPQSLASPPQSPSSLPQSPSSLPQSPASPFQPPATSLLTQPSVATVNPYKAFLAEFPAVVNKSEVLHKPSRDVEYHTCTTSPTHQVPPPFGW